MHPGYQSKTPACAAHLVTHAADLAKVPRRRSSVPSVVSLSRGFIPPVATRVSGTPCSARRFGRARETRAQRRVCSRTPRPPRRGLAPRPRPFPAGGAFPSTRARTPSERRRWGTGARSAAPPRARSASGADPRASRRAARARPCARRRWRSASPPGNSRRSPRTRSCGVSTPCAARSNPHPPTVRRRENRTPPDAARLASPRPVGESPRPRRAPRDRESRRNRAERAPRAGRRRSSIASRPWIRPLSPKTQTSEAHSCAPRRASRARSAPLRLTPGISADHRSPSSRSVSSPRCLSFVLLVMFTQAAPFLTSSRSSRAAGATRT